jgi:glycosyltransferase involved in cell wall biosynthesis
MQNKLNCKILLITTIYPAPDLRYGTSAIHYFTKEWIKMGYDVRVIHYQVVYPTIFYLVAKLFRDVIASSTGNIVFVDKEKDDKHYTLDGVSVDRYPIFKWIPHGRFSQKVIHKQIDKIIYKNKEDNFVPDIIIGHFSNPQLKIVSILKKYYSARTCMIMHDNGISIKQIYKNDYKELMDNIDIWGYRSIPIQKGFENNFGKEKHSFLCYSGIPDKYISQTNDRNFPEDLKSFIFVGSLIKLKNVNSIVAALAQTYPQKNFKLTLIGEGNEKKEIVRLIEKLDIKPCVKFYGNILRDDVQKEFEKSDCFIMISKPEAFGLVYLEAMSRGCITIGSKDQGIDGVIQHGKNGFLCDAGNENELADIIRNINSLTSDERKNISQNAIETTKELTDYKTAYKYISTICN